MRLKVNFDENNSCINTKFIQTNCTFNINFGEIVPVRTDEVYTGEYNVIPRVYQQTLNTKNKVMIDDVSIEIIPLAKVINLSNGYTVTIG